MNKTLKDWILNWFKFRPKDIYYLYIPAVFGIIASLGFWQLYSSVFNVPGVSVIDSLVFLWNTVLLSLVVGSLMVSMKADLRTREGIGFQQVGYIIIIAGLLMFFSVMLQALSLNNTSTFFARIGSKLGLIAVLFMFSGLAMFMFTIAARLVKSVMP